MIVERWAVEEEWLPTSSLDVLRYLEVMGYPIPRDPKTRKPTTGEMELEILLGKLEQDSIYDAVLPHVLAARKMKKGRGYLLDRVLGRDARMHPEFTFLPETGRLSSRNPNFQNQPQGRDDTTAWDLVEQKIARLIRSTVVPTPGYVLMEADWRSMEALLLSYFANDPSYARISRLGAHAYLLSHILNQPASLEWDDKKLGAYLSKLKKDHDAAYKVAKIANLADTYDVGVVKLAKVLKVSRTRAQEIKDIRKKAFPLIAQWQLATRLRAHNEGKLMNPFGYVMYFWNVFDRPHKPRRDGKLWVPGAQAHECLAFLPQSSNAAMLRQILLEFAALHLDWMFLLVPIHDALLVEVREEMVMEGAATLRRLMQRPWSELQGLSVEVDIKVGKNWNEMKEMR